ncbi:hypothetical protein ACIBO2_43595 [Nonomuraea sp. NPDC050022]|uniref:hypothetical protein n=1 Tax=Nonomuraea sp. NPDC050022 TaxID=3364358 RepID=UPI0037889D54
MIGGRVVRTIVYDTGTLLAAERRNPDFLAPHDKLTAAHIRPIVPVVVLAQAWRGGPQHQISRVLKGRDILPSDQRTGRAAGGTSSTRSSSRPPSSTKPPWSPATPTT